MFSLSIDPRAYLAAGDRFVSDLAASSESILRAVAGAAVVEMANRTAPGGWGKIGESSVLLGESTLKRDAYSILTPIVGAASPEPVGQIVKRHRGPDGRVRATGKKIVVSMADFQQYLRKTLPHVGYTAGGWNEAARALGRELSPFMTDHPGPGSISIIASPDGVVIEFRNDVPWFATMAYAADRMAAVLAPYEKQLAETLERAARQAGARAGLT